MYSQHVILRKWDLTLVAKNVDEKYLGQHVILRMWDLTLGTKDVDEKYLKDHF